MVPNKFRGVFCECENSDEIIPKKEFAGMAKKNSDNIVDKDNASESEILICHCGATSTLTKLMFNITDVETGTIMIQRALDKEPHYV